MPAGPALPAEWMRLAGGVVALRPDAPADLRLEIAIVRLLRVVGSSDDQLTVVVGPGQAQGVFDLVDLALVCTQVRPGIDLRVNVGGNLQDPQPVSPVIPVAPRLPSLSLAALAGEIFGSTPVEWATYTDAVAAEYRGIPVVAERDGVLCVGIDPRDQLMAREAQLPVAEHARHVFEVVVSGGRAGRSDLGRYGIGRRLRALVVDGIEPFEIGTLGRGPDRAFASRGERLVGFASGTNPMVVLEAAVLCAREARWSEVSLVLEGPVHPLLGELSRLLRMAVRFEPGEVSGG